MKQSDDEKRRPPRRRRRRHNRDFWELWQEKQRRRWETKAEDSTTPQQSDPPHFNRRQQAQRWRDHFHAFMGTYPEDHWAIGGRRFSPWRQGEADYNPLLAALMSKGGGLLPLLVLKLLAKEPLYGNELMDRISELTAGQWLANPGAVYPLMTMLETRELVSGEWDDPRKRTVRRYQLTDAGRLEYERLRAIIRPKLTEAIVALREIAGFLGDGGSNEKHADEIEWL